MRRERRLRGEVEVVHCLKLSVSVSSLSRIHVSNQFAVKNFCLSIVSIEMSFSKTETSSFSFGLHDLQLIVKKHFTSSPFSTYKLVF